MSTFDDLIKKVQAESQRDAERIAVQLLSEGMPDSEKLTKEQYLSFFRRNWPDINFRMARLEAVGAENFLKTVKEAFGGKQW